MSATLQRERHTFRTGPAHRVSTAERAGFWRRHWVSIAHLLPLLAVAGLAAGVNLTGAPQRIDDEGTYAAQAYAVTHFGELTHYTYWYDHPPLGWLQLAAWDWLTAAFARADYAVFAGREMILLAHLASVALLWVLARRIGLGRTAASGAGLLFALSPLAVHYSRLVYIDNIALPWALAAFALAASRGRQLLAFGGAALCFGVAVLSKETFLLLLPFLVWQMWRCAHPETRRYTLTVAGSLLALLGIGYLGLALLKGELLPGEGRVSLFDGVAWQLAGRSGSGSVLEASSQAGATARRWLQLDSVLPLAAVVAGVAGLLIRRVRPYAAAYLFLAAFLLRPGYLPTPYIIVMLPLAALVVAAVVEAGVRSRSRWLVASSVIAGLALVAVAAPAWAGPLRTLWTADQDRPLQQAQAWLARNATANQKLLVDDAVWVDLVSGRFDRQNVVWYYKADTDPAVRARAPRGWRSYSYLLSTRSLRDTDEPAGTLQKAYANSRPVAEFGTGEQHVEVRRIYPGGGEASGERRRQRARAAAGRRLLQNPDLDVAAPARSLLADGQVAGTVMARLTALSGDHELRISGFPTTPADTDQAARHVVAISSVDGRPADSPTGGRFVRAVRRSAGAYQPRQVTRTDGDAVLRFRLAGAGVIGAAAEKASSAHPGQVRLLDLTPGRADARVRLTSFSGGEQIELGSPGYGEASTHRDLPTGVYTVSVPGDTAGEWRVDSVVRIAPWTSYSLTVAGRGTRSSVTTVTDDLSGLPSGEARVRLLAAAPQADRLDARVVDGPVLAQQVPYGTATGYASVPEQTWRVRIRPGDGRAPVTHRVELEAGRVYTLMVVQGGRGSGPRLVPVVDSRGR